LILSARPSVFMSSQRLSNAIKLREYNPIGVQRR
jgi:hypothetical protein